MKISMFKWNMKKKWNYSHWSPFKWIFLVQFYRFCILLPCWGIQVLLQFSLPPNRVISYPDRWISLVKHCCKNVLWQILLMLTEECHQKTLGAWLTPVCFPCRIFQRTSGECGKVLKWHVRPDIWHAVHAELGGVPGPFHRAEAVLHRRQCELGGNAERFLGSAAGTDVPAHKPPVPFHWGLPGVCKQVHRPAEALWRCTQEAEGSSD